MQFRTIEKSDPSISPLGLQWITVKSAALQGRADVTYFIPAKAIGASDLPVYVLLHGVYGSHWAWALRGGAHQVLQQMVDDGQLAPAILVMPSDGLWGDGSGYARHTGRDFEKWIGEELPALIRQEVTEAGSSFYIGGLSMGGYGAFRIGIKFLETFAGISGHSSVTSLDQMPLFAEEDWNDDVRKIRDRSIVDCMKGAKGRLPAIRFDCGVADELLQHNRALHQDLIELQIAHTYEEFDGGHSWEYWHEHVRRTYLFFDELESMLAPKT